MPVLLASQIFHDPAYLAVDMSWVVVGSRVSFRDVKKMHCMHYQETDRKMANITYFSVEAFASSLRASEAADLDGTFGTN
jgi:hypothetical protein